MVLNYSKLYLGHLKNSKKIILISTIGLICAIAIVSSSLLYVDSTKGEIVDGILKSYSSDYSYDVSIQINHQNPNINTQLVTNELTNISTNLQTQADLNIFNNLELFFTMQNVYTPIKVYNPYSSNITEQNMSVTFVELNSEIRKDLSQFISTNSTFPSNHTNIQEAFALEYFSGIPNPYLQYYKDHNLLDLKNSSNITIYSDTDRQSYSYGFNITGHGKVYNPYIYNSANNYYSGDSKVDVYPALSKIWNKYGSTLYLFVNNLTQFSSQMHPNVYYNFNRYNVQLNVFGGFTIDFSKIDPFSISSKTTAINKFANSLRDKIFNSAFYNELSDYQPNLNVQFNTQYAYQSMGSATTTILFNMLIYALPILIVALFMTNYSFGLIHKQVTRHIGIYKTRGASHYLMLIFESIDFLLILAISIIMGALSGIPIASLVAKTDFLLSFNNQTNYNIINNFVSNLPSIFESLLYFSILISMIVNLRRTLKLANMQIVDTENPTEKSDPYWKKHYIDLILFFYGTISYLILIYFTTGNQAQNINPIITIFLLLALPSPFAMVIGAILMINRLIPVLLNWIGTNLWHHSGGLLAFSFKNVIRHRQASTRAVMLIATLLTFLILFYSLPYSQVSYNQRSSIYDAGAEGLININSYQFNNITNIGEIIHNISSILQNNFSSVLNGYSPYFSGSTNDQNNYNNMQLIFINSSSYEQGSAINDFNPGLKNGLDKDLENLRTINNSLLINQQAFKDRYLSIGDNITVKVSESDVVEYPIVDTFSLWPSTTRNNWNTQLFGIIDMNHILHSNATDLSKIGFMGVQKFGFYLNFNEGVNKTAVAEQISSVTGMPTTVTSYTPQYYDIYSSLIFQFSLGQINTNVIMSLVIGVVILIMFSYMQLNDRRREIFTEAALGMKISQTGVLFFVESIILFMSGIIIGTVLGTFFVQMLAVFQTQGSQIPPYIVLIPWNLVLETYLGFLFLTIISAIIPAYYVTKQDISKSFGEV